MLKIAPLKIDTFNLLVYKSVEFNVIFGKNLQMSERKDDFEGKGNVSGISNQFQKVLMRLDWMDGRRICQIFD